MILKTFVNLFGCIILWLVGAGFALRYPHFVFGLLGTGFAYERVVQLGDQNIWLLLIPIAVMESLGRNWGLATQIAWTFFIPLWTSGFLYDYSWMLQVSIPPDQRPLLGESTHQIRYPLRYERMRG